VVVNRVPPQPGGGDSPPSALAALLADAGAPDPEGLAARAADALAAARARSAADRHEIRAIAGALDAPPITTVPALDDDPVEVAGLARVTRELEGG